MINSTNFIEREFRGIAKVNGRTLKRLTSKTQYPAETRDVLERFEWGPLMYIDVSSLYSQRLFILCSPKTTEGGMI